MIKGVEGGPDELFSGWRGVRPINVWRGLLSLLAGKEFRAPPGVKWGKFRRWLLAPSRVNYHPFHMSHNPFQRFLFKIIFNNGLQP